MSISVALVCLGNICRSPMADVILQQRVLDAGLGDQIQVVSAGTANWHSGKPMDPRSAETLARAGYDPTRHRAQHFTADWYAEHDLLLAMDESNYADMTALAPTVAEQSIVQMYRDFDPLATPTDNEVPDPYYGGSQGFDLVLQMVERTSDKLLEHLRSRL